MAELGLHESMSELKKIFSQPGSTKGTDSGKKKTRCEDSESLEYLLEDDSQGDNDDDDESLDEEQPTPLKIEVLVLSWLWGLGK